MTTVDFKVPNISCGHCVHTIQMELGELSGVKLVRADQSDQTVHVEFEDPANKDQIVALLTELNYPPAN
ncbi:MAG: heavy-metal-associated domain-containing protein [Anaerolineales bacterium]|jgi:copper chaperone CopZ